MITSRILCILSLAAAMFVSGNAFAETDIVAPCDSTTHQSDWLKIDADASIDVTITAGAQQDGKSCNIQTTAWNRDHWTVTCWVTSSGATYTSYECHNWNTVFGDSWHASFMYMACPTTGCVTDAKEKGVIAAVRRSLNSHAQSVMQNREK